MLASSGKRVDDVMVIVRGNNLKKVLVSADNAVLVEVKTTLQFFGCPNIQKQGRAAHILLRYEPTYTTFSAVENISIPRGEQHLTTLIFPHFKSLWQIGFETSDSEQAAKPVVEEIAKQPSQSALEVEVGEDFHSAFEAAGLNQPDPLTSGRGEVSFEDIFTDLRDLPGFYPENMAGETLTQMARKKNAERMASWRRAETIRSEPTPTESFEPIIVEETAQIGMAETVQEAEWPIPEDWREEKRPAESEVGSEENPIDKRPCLEESDVVAPFVVQPKIKNMLISSEASTLKDPAVVLSLASSVSLPANKATFRAEPNLVAIALAAQSAFLTVGRIVEIDRKSARAKAEAERARSSDQLRLATEERANASKDSLKLAKEVIAKLEAKLEESKKAKEIADSEASKAFEVGKGVALENYVEEVPKFENRGFKHGWLKALAVADVTLAMSIPYEQVDVKPLESDSED
ncbi:hypothetical protein CsSME_00003515 [Camellia sinensis var. sinensis]